jgi:hypothetical protein
VDLFSDNHPKALKANNERAKFQFLDILKKLSTVMFNRRYMFLSVFLIATVLAEARQSPRLPQFQTRMSKMPLLILTGD